MIGKTAFSVEHLDKSYKGTPVLSDICFSFEQGRSYCIMGPSGIGKTTFLRILMGLETQDSGSIPGLSGLRVSAVFQENRLMEGYTAAENISFVTGKHVAAGEINRLLLLLLPKEALGKPVREFSGGMKRRAAILRAMLAPSELLILDEPFSGLDEETKKKTAGLILSLRQGRTLLMVSHDTKDAALLEAEIIRL